MTNYVPSRDEDHRILSRSAPQERGDKTTTDIAREIISEMADPDGVFSTTAVAERLMGRTGVNRGTANATVWSWSDPTDQVGFRRQRINSVRTSVHTPSERPMFKFPKEPERLVQAVRPMMGEVKDFKELGKMLKTQDQETRRYTSYDQFMRAVDEIVPDIADVNGWFKKSTLVSALDRRKGIPATSSYRHLAASDGFDRRGMSLRRKYLASRQQPVTTEPKPEDRRDVHRELRAKNLARGLTSAGYHLTNPDGPYYMSQEDARRNQRTRGAQVRGYIMTELNAMKGDGKLPIFRKDFVDMMADKGISSTTTLKALRELEDDKLISITRGNLNLVEGLPGGVEAEEPGEPKATTEAINDEPQRQTSGFDYSHEQPQTYEQVKSKTPGIDEAIDEVIKAISPKAETTEEEPRKRETPTIQKIIQEEGEMELRKIIKKMVRKELHRILDL